ncbi:hypothetical protein Ddc_15774 [Ditylenchus destructor]|nr:hypothetical protein Ddc_15774 [Ditylenchus destructor]
MWISSSSIKNRVSDRGRIDIFSRGSISAVKASLLLLALKSFYREGIGINGDEITWDTRKSPGASSIVELYSHECGKLLFIISDLAGLDKKCKFSMRYDGCDMDIEWKKRALFFAGKE